MPLFLALPCVLCPATLFADTFGGGACTMDFVDIGNAGNAADIHGAGHGAVDYSYRMKAVILGAPRYRQHMTLEIARHEGGGEVVFEVERCLALGWVRGEEDVEDGWKSE